SWRASCASGPVDDQPRTPKENQTMKSNDQYDLLTAALAVLALRKGGKITLPLRDILACNDRYNVAIEEDRQGQTLTVEVRETGLCLFRGGNGPVPRQIVHRGGGNRPA